MPVAGQVGAEGLRIPAGQVVHEVEFVAGDEPQDGVPGRVEGQPGGVRHPQFPAQPRLRGAEDAVPVGGVEVQQGRCSTPTPLGRPVEPDVKMTYARSCWPAAGSERGRVLAGQAGHHQGGVQHGDGDVRGQFVVAMPGVGPCRVNAAEVRSRTGAASSSMPSTRPAG